MPVRIDGVMQPARRDDASVVGTGPVGTWAVGPSVCGGVRVIELRWYSMHGALAMGAITPP